VKQAGRRAIVDIGSNSIRLVAFGGSPRAPVPLFNEKVMAGLGRGVVENGSLAEADVALALKGLARFAALIKMMEPSELRVVATAAVRDAANGPDFLAKVRDLGLPVEVLSGDEEALVAALGVVSTHPQADGLVADLGGGSLELARVKNGQVSERMSLPLGVMRVATIRAGGTGRLRKFMRSQLAEHGWIKDMAGSPIYLVGGAWRVLARVHMHVTRWPLGLIDNYTFPASDARSLKASVREFDPVQLLAIRGVKQARVSQIDDAAALLAALVALIEPSDVVLSASGLREGLLFQRLSATMRGGDPLIEGLRHAIGAQLQGPRQDEALLKWSDGAFPDELPAERRLRHAVCLIAGTGWASSPEFRSLAGEDMALHGAWSGVDHAERAVMAMALHVALGGDPDDPPNILYRLASDERLARAKSWGHALRLAHRLTGGSAKSLPQMPLSLEQPDGLVLRVPKSAVELIDSGVERSLARLGLSLGRDARLEV
jgi:exopolyphosphatase / guanosine-5'-triphosphate,3'-diphosphate pyrophosphatase